MIVSKISDGLGNQLFQYAAGRRLASKHQVPLKLDISWYHQDEYSNTKRNYFLDQFDITATEATQTDLYRVVRFGKYGWLTANSFLNNRYPRAIGKGLNYYKEILEEPDSEAENWPHRRRFCSELLEAGPSAYLNGFWQSKKYFEPIADLLREELTVITPLDGKNAEFAELIDQNVAVSIHVRRGDLISRGPPDAEHGHALPPSYYDMCIDQLKSRLDDPTFFVFSNDPAWASDNIRFDDNMYFASHNDGDTAHEDLRLMRRCDHHIVANSTFSWWGAFLNGKPQKEVLAPFPWKPYGYPKGILKEWDLFPPEWELIEYQ